MHVCMYGASSCAQLITGTFWPVNAKHPLCTHDICSLQFHVSSPENGPKKQTHVSEAQGRPIVHEWSKAWSDALENVTVHLAGYGMKTEVCPHKGDTYLLESHEKSILKSNQLNHTTGSEGHADLSWIAKRSLYNLANMPQYTNSANTVAFTFGGLQEFSYKLNLRTHQVDQYRGKMLHEPLSQSVTITE